MPTTTDPYCRYTFASLRLFGDDLQPNVVSEELGITPADLAQKGAESTGPRSRRKVAPTGRWIHDSEHHIDSTNAEDHVLWLLDQLEPARVIPAELPGVSRACVCCYWESKAGHGGPVITPATLSRLAALGLALEFDVYFPDDKEGIEETDRSAP